MFPANLRGSVVTMELLRRGKMPAIDRSVVADVPLFSGLTPGDLDEILREARSVRYPKDAAVFEQGADADPSSYCCTAICVSRRPRRRATRSWCATSRPGETLRRRAGA